MKNHADALSPSAPSIFPPAFYTLAFAGLCFFFWFLGGRAVFRNDEQQHLHAALSSAEGKLPYRDYFDNHVPAFQFLAGLEIKALGIKPSPDLPVMMRRLAFPWLAAQLLLLVLISRSVFYEDRERYLSAALLGGALLPFMAAQARPEPLWGTLFLLSLYLFSSRRPSVKSFFLVGLVNGLNTCVSLKTLAFPALPELLSLPVLFALYPAGLIASSGAALLGGLLVFPGLLLLYFGHAGALAEFFHFAIFYTLRAAPGSGGHIGIAVAAIFLASGLSYFAAKVYNSRIRAESAAFIVPVAFSLAVLFLYPVREAQTVYPFTTLAYLCLGALAVKGLWAVFSGLRARRTALALLLLAAVSGRLALEKAFADNNAGYRKDLSVMLKLQPGPGGMVMDAKGESLFWRRPFFYALETFAVQGLKDGTIKDSIPQDCAREAAPVAYMKYSYRFTPADMAFFNGNYLPVCGAPDVIAAGKRLGGGSFEVLLPLAYRVLCSSGAAAGGLLDGRKYAGGTVRLAAGPHSFKPAAGCGGAILALDRAAETGLLPCGYGGKI